MGQKTTPNKTQSRWKKEDQHDRRTKKTSEEEKRINKEADSKTQKKSWNDGNWARRGGRTHNLEITEELLKSLTLYRLS